MRPEAYYMIAVVDNLPINILVTKMDHIEKTWCKYNNVSNVDRDVAMRISELRSQIMEWYQDDMYRDPHGTQTKILVLMDRGLHTKLWLNYWPIPNGINIRLSNYRGPYDTYRPNITQVESDNVLEMIMEKINWGNNCIIKDVKDEERYRNMEQVDNLFIFIKTNLSFDELDKAEHIYTCADQPCLVGYMYRHLYRRELAPMNVKMVDGPFICNLGKMQINHVTEDNVMNLVGDLDIIMQDAQGPLRFPTMVNRSMLIDVDMVEMMLRQFSECDICMREYNTPRQCPNCKHWMCKTCYGNVCYTTFKCPFCNHGILLDLINYITSEYNVLPHVVCYPKTKENYDNSNNLTIDSIGAYMSDSSYSGILLPHISIVSDEPEEIYWMILSHIQRMRATYDEIDYIILSNGLFDEDRIHLQHILDIDNIWDWHYIIKPH